MTTAEHYSHPSGLGAGWLLPVVGIVGAVASAIPYMFADVQESMSGFLSIPLVALLVAGTSLPVAFGARLTRCASPGYLHVVASLSAVCGLYAAWVFFALGISAQPFAAAPDIATDVAWISRFVRHTNAEGWYSIFDVRPTGVILGALWVLEAMLVVSVAWWMAPRFLRGRALCWNCRVWCRPDRELLVPVSAGKTMKGIRKHGLASLEDVTIPDGESSRTLQIYTWKCPRPACEFAVFGANQLHQTKGRRSVDDAFSEPVIPPSIRREEDVADIERIRQSLKEARGRQFANVEVRPPIEPRVDQG